MRLGFLNKNDLSIKYEANVTDYANSSSIDLKKEVNMITSILPITYCSAEKKKLTSILTLICDELSKRGDTIKIPPSFFTNKRTLNEKKKYSFFKFFGRNQKDDKSLEEIITPIKEKLESEIQEEVRKSFSNTSKANNKEEDFNNYIKFLETNSLLYNEFSYYSDINRERSFEDKIFFKKNPLSSNKERGDDVSIKKNIMSQNKKIRRNKNSNPIKEKEEEGTTMESLLSIDSEEPIQPPRKTIKKKTGSKRVVRKKRLKENVEGLIDESYFDQ